ncbi:MAG: hypothetical protein DRJ42_04215 [Deltaproteobacteria bacterium]|nr:MAG: hypothetical protein DRJ42_04215 [Deltaproteobacteria bacterium]
MPFDPPIDAARAAQALVGRPGLAWLDGGPAHEAEGRRSYVGACPVEVHRVRAGETGGLPPFDEPAEDSAAPRWMGFISYDATTVGEPRRTVADREYDDSPVIWFGRYDACLSVDDETGEAWLVGDDEAACKRLESRIREGLVDNGTPPPVSAQIGPAVVDDPALHRRAIEAALEHIGAGDIYQVNLARRWRADYEGEPLALFLAMREASPVPLGGFIDAGDHAVLARTMERFLHWEGPGGELSTRPIKGTIARSGDDAGEAEALRSDDKERAEHAMIVDLMRNDLGRVAEVGTVTVEAPLVVEPYRGLAHLVSTVRCRTRPDVDLGAILDATFPPGSVTGTPKVRAMQIIEELEVHPREVYTGCIGLVDRRGGARFAVAIRTAQVRRGEVVYHAGGGLVSASQPDREVAETELKARAFLDAVAELRGD